MSPPYIEQESGRELTATPLLEGCPEREMLRSQSGQSTKQLVQDDNQEVAFNHGLNATSPPFPVVLTFRNNTLAHRLQNGFRQMVQNVTLEPMLFMKMVAESNYKVVADTLEIDRVCRINLNYTAEECLLMDDGNHSDVQSAVQKYENLFNYYQNLIDSILPLIVVVIIGSMTDRFGRKPPMLAVLAGFVGAALVNLITALNPSWPVQVLLAAPIVVDMTGTWVVFNMAVYSYVADITSRESRVKRMGLLDVVWYLGDPIGRLMGGWLYQWSGYIAVFSVSVGLWTLCFLYVLILVRESVDTRAVTEDAEDAKYAHCGPFKHIIILFRTAFKRRSGNLRSLLFSLLALKLMVFLIQGHQMYLWARRVLGWGPTEFSTWTSVDSLVHMGGTVVWMLTASYFRLHETIIATGGVISQGLWCIVLACITGPALWWLVIIATPLGMLEQTIEPAIRTMLTVVVEQHEAGKILALNGLLESAWLTVDRTIYTALYNSCVDTFPQVNFVVEAGICILVCMAFLVLFMVFKKQAIPIPPQGNARSHAANVSSEIYQDQYRSENRGNVY